MAKFLKDLGLVQYGNQGRKRRKFLVKCEQCGQEEYTIDKYDFESNLNCVCRKCQVINRSATMIKNKSITFIERANKVHKNKYDYSETIYIGAHRKVTILCAEHGKFTIKAYAHLNGQGCNKCGYISVANSKRKTTEDFIKNAVKVHGEKYDYSLVDYTGNNKKVTIICPVHGEFKQTPNRHLSGNNCKKCDSIRENNVIYIWNVPNTDNYKIGITSDRLKNSRLHISARSLSKSLGYKVLPDCVFRLKTEYALEVEKQLLREFTTNPYSTLSIDGKTEYRTLTPNDLKTAINIASSFITKA